MDSQKHKHPHFVLVTIAIPGHFIPMLDIAILLARRGLTVSIITTPKVASIFSPKVDRVLRSGHQISLVSLKFPAVEVGLPEGCETMDSVGSLEALSKLMLAVDKMQKSVEELLHEIEPYPSCIIADKNIGWLADTACKLNVPRIIFDGMSCFSAAVNHSLLASRVHEAMPESENFTLPGFPHGIEFKTTQLPCWFSLDPCKMTVFLKKREASESQAYGILVNSFEELEPQYVEHLKKLTGSPIWCVGPVGMCDINSEKEHRRKEWPINESMCLKWLDSHAPGSVVYVCFGSTCCLSLPQLIELGLGLEASNRPFIWVMKENKHCKGIDKWIRDDGFEKRTEGRGLIIKGWAPQVLILSHPSVGAFLTHCGWNSTLEGISSGLPMITWPRCAEQFYSEKYLVNVVEIGVSIGATLRIPLFQEDKFGVVVTREMVAEAVEKAIDGGLEGGERRSRAKVLAEMAKKATREGGSSYSNMTLLIQDVLRIVCSRK